MGSFLSNRAIEGGQQKRLRGEDARKEGAMSAAQREEALRHQAVEGLGPVLLAKRDFSKGSVC